MGFKKGMTLIEILVVVGIIGILVAIAVPALAQIMPYAELRSDARYVATAMRQARLKAANTHKPVRVVVDCSQAAGCTLRTYVAVFADGTEGNGALGDFAGWEVSPGLDAVHRFENSVTVLDNDKLNDGLGAPVGTGNNIFWAVFLPSSRVIASHAPFRITLSSTRNSATQTLVVNGVTGRATVTDSSQL